jgi:prolyl oligopeptidase
VPARQDVYAWVSVDHTPGFERTTFGRATSFYSNQQFLLQGEKQLPIDKPADAKLAFWREHLLLELRSDWTVGGKTWPRGALLVANAAGYLKGERQFTALFTPSATRSLEDYTATRSRLVLNVLDNVASRLEEWQLQSSTWQKREVKAPYPGRLSAQALHDPLLAQDTLAESYLLNAADFLQPDSLQLGRTGSDERQHLKSRPTYVRSSNTLP